jgi:hypothetical protein
VPRKHEAGVVTIESKVHPHKTMRAVQVGHAAASGAASCLTQAVDGPRRVAPRRGRLRGAHPASCRAGPRRARTSAASLLRLPGNRQACCPGLCAVVWSKGCAGGGCPAAGADGPWGCAGAHHDRHNLRLRCGATWRLWSLMPPALRARGLLLPADLHLYLGQLPGMKRGDVLGHEMMGVGEAAGCAHGCGVECSVHVFVSPVLHHPSFAALPHPPRCK